MFLLLTSPHPACPLDLYRAANMVSGAEPCNTRLVLNLLEVLGIHDLMRASSIYEYGSKSRSCQSLRSAPRMRFVPVPTLPAPLDA